jgi:hypothetical protein
VRQHGWLPRPNASQLGSLVDGEGALARWCAQQQRRWEGSQGPRLSREEAAALLAIPGWECWPSRRVLVPWEQQCRELAEFVRQYGGLLRISTGEAEPLLPGEKVLGEWCYIQRQRKKSAEAPLWPEQETALETIPGWVWEEWQQVPWEQGCREVAEFVQQCGRLPRRKGSEAKPFLPGEKQLGYGCHTQRNRRKCKGAPLSAEQDRALAAIPD